MKAQILNPRAQVLVVGGGLAGMTAAHYLAEWGGAGLPRYVDADRCDNCGACAAVCPAARPHPYDGDLAPQKAIYPPPPRAVPFVYVLDPEACIRCGACVDVCPHGAIGLEVASREERVEVGAVLLWPGFSSFDAAHAAEYGWGHYPNVVTSLQFERMLNRSGPTRGRILRPSDGLSAHRIAFIHCVFFPQ